MEGRPFGAQPRKAAAKTPPTPSFRGQNGQSGRPEPWGASTAPDRPRRAFWRRAGGRLRREWAVPVLVGAAPDPLPALARNPRRRPLNPPPRRASSVPLRRHGGWPRDSAQAATAGGARRGFGRAVQGLAANAAGAWAADNYAQHQIMTPPTRWSGGCAGGSWGSGRAKRG